ncbi:hypothetical protein MKW92_024048 [Papaver armeniacum]|nr:hypothetical protein MKW92_024048 [Papaver armeniacum]
MAATKRKHLSSSSSYQPVLTPKKDNKTSNASAGSWDRKKKEFALRLRSASSRKSTFRDICIKAAELEAYHRHPNSDRNEEKLQKDMHRSVVEEMRKQDQASLASTLTRYTAQRLLDDKKTLTKGVLESGRKLAPEEKCETEKVKIDKKPIKLTSVTIFPEVGGQGGDAMVGTLEVHVDGCTYTTSSSHFHMQFMFKKVKVAFYRVEDEEKMLPLLHFHLHHPIEVGKEKTNDIQFRLLPTPVGQRTFDSDSDKFVKENQTRDKGDSEDLKNFVAKVQNKWRVSPSPFSFHRVYKDEEFCGVLPTEAPAVFGLPLLSLVGLADLPFRVINLEDIEIVNLARLRPGKIDMTIVFKDFSRDVLQISSIPLDSLNNIKRCLTFGGVKYYENDLDLPWDSIVKRISDSPKMFIQEGGWDAYKLEDSATSLYYRHYYLETSQDVYDDIIS